MGYQKEHNCPQCGYQAVVAGGPDVGMSRYYTLTISCVTCQELHDVEWLEPKYTTRSDGVAFSWRQRKLRCPESPDHEWEPFEGRCPVCSRELSVNEEGAGVHWD